MGREVPFHPELVCDDCGARGAYDFMGDYYCDTCATPPDQRPQDPARLAAASTGDKGTTQ